jgi:hypothetical protein
MVKEPIMNGMTAIIANRLCPNLKQRVLYFRSLDWRFWETYWTRHARMCASPEFVWPQGQDPIGESAGLLTRIHWRIRPWLIRQKDWRFWETREARAERIFREHERFCRPGCWCECQYDILEAYAEEGGLLTLLHWRISDLFLRLKRLIGNAGRPQ